jgi:hypothetical protein
MRMAMMKYNQKGAPVFTWYFAWSAWTPTLVSNAIKSARNIKDLDDFIIRSDSIVASLAHTIDSAYPTP